MKCIECNNAEKCLDRKEEPSLCGCTSGIPERTNLTNADRIRIMSDEELEEFITELNQCCLAGTGAVDCRYANCADCKEIVRKWLQSEVEENHGNEK